MAQAVEAVVLRTLRYGEADLIAHVLTREFGRRGVIAKGARKPRSRLGARLEPFLAVQLNLHEGRGDLAIVRGVDIAAAHDGVRASWQAQQLGAAALDLVSRVTVEHQPVEPAYHLLRSFLAQLDQVMTTASAGDSQSEQRAAALLTAFELKLLHALGFAPHLTSCVRCGSEATLAAFSAPDGGIVCSGCRTPVDQSLDVATWRTAVALLRDPLAAVAATPVDALPPSRELRTISSGIVASTCREHAGFTPRRS